MICVGEARYRWPRVSARRAGRAGQRVALWHPFRVEGGIRVVVLPVRVPRLIPVRGFHPLGRCSDARAAVHHERRHVDEEGLARRLRLVHLLHRLLAEEGRLVHPLPHLDRGERGGLERVRAVGVKVDLPLALLYKRLTMAITLPV